MARDTGGKPKGQRFSHLYLERPNNLTDSSRVRKRVAVLFSRTGPYDSRNWEFASFIEGETGEDIPWLGSNPYWEKFFTDCPLDTFLDCFTLVARHWISKRLPDIAANWLREAERILRDSRIRSSSNRSSRIRSGPRIRAGWRRWYPASVARLKSRLT